MDRVELMKKRFKRPGIMKGILLCLFFANLFMFFGIFATFGGLIAKSFINFFDSDHTPSYIFLDNENFLLDKSKRNNR